MLFSDGAGSRRFQKLLRNAAWALEVFESWGSKQWLWPWRARGARAYNGGLAAEPPAGSRGRAPGGGLGGRSPPEAESFLVLERPTERQNSKMSKSIRLSLTSQCRRLKLLGEQELWPALPCQKLGSSCSLCSPCSNAHVLVGKSFL